MAPGRWFIARHGETVFNAAGRMQGDAVHTPLTRTGFAQAEAIGRALAARLGRRPPLSVWASDTGRAQQTLAIVLEHLELDWHEARSDRRLREIDVGAWSGRYYRDVARDEGPVVDRATGLFSRPPPGGEWYPDVAARLREWIDATAAEGGDRLVVMHGMASRVLRGLLLDLPPSPGCEAPVATGLPQGSVVELADGAETVLLRGEGFAL